EAPAMVERNKPVVDAVKDNRGYAHPWQQVDDVDVVDRPSQVYIGSRVGDRDACKFDERFELLGRSGRQPKRKEGTRENQAVVTPAMPRHREKCLRFLGILRRFDLMAPLHIAPKKHKLRYAGRTPHRIADRRCGSSRYPKQREALQRKGIDNRLEIVKHRLE